MPKQPKQPNPLLPHVEQARARYRAEGLKSKAIHEAIGALLPAGLNPIHALAVATAAVYKERSEVFSVIQQTALIDHFDAGYEAGFHVFDLLD